MLRPRPPRRLAGPRGRLKSEPCWVTIHVAATAAEAEIIRTFLRQADIPTLKKPDNLSAYAPSPYREIVVPQAQAEEGREIIRELLSQPAPEDAT